MHAMICNNEAKRLLHTENLREIPIFLKACGSNWALKEDAVYPECYRRVQWQAQKGWRALRQRRASMRWWCLLDAIITDFRRGG